MYSFLESITVVEIVALAVCGLVFYAIYKSADIGLNNQEQNQ